MQLQSLPRNLQPGVALCLRLFPESEMPQQRNLSGLQPAVRRLRRCQRLSEHLYHPVAAQPAAEASP